MVRHNKLCDWITDLAGKSFTLTHICDNPSYLQDVQ